MTDLDFQKLPSGFITLGPPKIYKLKPLPPDTDISVLLEIFNLLEFTLIAYKDQPKRQNFIDKHPELVEEI